MTTEPTPKPAPCDPACPGFAIFNADERPEIQRCMDCDRFASDLDAMEYIVAMARAAEKSRLRPRPPRTRSRVDPHGGPWLPTDPCGRPLPDSDHDPLVCSGCGAEGITLCVRVNQTTGQVDTEDPGGFPWCPRCKQDGDELGPVPRSQYVDPGPGDCVDALIHVARLYADGSWTREEARDYFAEYGPGLVRSQSKTKLLSLAIVHAGDNAEDLDRALVVSALDGTVGAAFLSTVFKCF